MKKYLKVVSKSFQKQAAYKVEYFVGLLNGLLFIFIFTSLWKAIYAQSDTATLRGPFDLESIVTYAVLAMVIKISFSMDDNATSFKMRTGAMAMDLIKPISYYFFYLAESVGYSLFHVFSRGIPLLAFSLLVFHIRFPTQPWNYLLLLLSGTMGYCIFFNINYLVGLLSFWFIETFSFQLMKYGLFTLFAGGILPVDFFPDSIRPMVALLPFPHILYTPTAVFMGHPPPDGIGSALITQFCWAAILPIFSWLAWKAAIKKLVVQGG
jgi:ABC-2 type transport system permease protein